MNLFCVRKTSFTRFFKIRVVLQVFRDLALHLTFLVQKGLVRSMEVSQKVGLLSEKAGLLALCSLLFLLCSAFAQQQTHQQAQKPLTQTEYVRLLFDLEKNPKKRDEVIQIIRTRGIDFEVTDGIRGLTATKSRNDTELRRVLEEAARKRKNPAIATLPSERESFEILTKARTVALETVEKMPDFVVKQAIQRFIAYAGTNNFQTLDRLIVAVSYRSDGREEYKVLSINGVLQDDSNYKSSYEEVGGTSSTGEFVTVLATVFKPENETKFRLIDTDLINQRRAFIYEFEIEKERARQQIVSVADSYASTISGMKGRVWIDQENFRVLRIESEATEIPSDFPVKSAIRKIDYGWVTIADREYFLPVLSEVRLVFRQDGKLFETRNLIRFREYRKFGSEVRVLDEDEEIIKENPNR
ncbi:MAG: hypothetical protein D6687_01460 [Acidobacteria bacterium]|nr:MAG: hypothetical protein D6687_01460 [Acidobacteriota bacterium]